MAFIDSNPEISKDQQPFLSLLRIVISALIAFSIAFSIILLLHEIFNIDYSTMAEATENPAKYPHFKNLLLLDQAIISFFLFVISPVIYIYWFERKTLSILSVPGRISLISVGLVALIVIAFMPLNSWIIDWNQNLHFPEFLSDFEKWARQKEEKAAELTKILTSMNSFGDFLATFIVVAVIAAIGEELIFRGLLQNKLFALFNNIHVAIWLSGILFSAIHLQFLGFIPRMLLGVLFGYLYYWSKNIWIPIFAHFINNGFTVIALYLYNLKYVEYNMEEAAKAPLSLALTGLVATSMLVFSFWKYYKNKHLLQ